MSPHAVGGSDGGVSPHAGMGSAGSRPPHAGRRQSRDRGRSSAGTDHVPQVPLGNRVQIPWPYRSEDLPPGWLDRWQSTAQQSGAWVTMRAMRNSRWRAHPGALVRCPNVLTVSGLDRAVFTPLLRGMLTELQHARVPTVGPFDVNLPDDDESGTQMWQVTTTGSSASVSIHKDGQTVLTVQTGALGTTIGLPPPRRLQGGMSRGAAPGGGLSPQATRNKVRSRPRHSQAARAAAAAAEAGAATVAVAAGTAAEA